MAHTKTTSHESRLVYQCGKGHRRREVARCKLIVANARTNMTDPNHSVADVIINDSCNKGIFIAPCAAKIERIYVNANVYPTNAAGTVTVKCTKAVIADTDVDLCTALAIDNNTDETAYDATLSTTSGALDLLEGQLVYVVCAVSNNAIVARSSGLIVNLEWRPTEA